MSNVNLNNVSSLQSLYSNTSIYSYNSKNSLSSSYLSNTYGKNISLTSEQTKSYLTDIKDISAKLKNITTDMLSKNSVFNKTILTSSNADSFTLKGTSSEKTDVKELQVTQLAKSQVNTGDSLNAKETAGVANGKNQFAVEIGGKHYYYDINVSSSDSNQTVQQKMADAINSKSNGLVKATVQYNEKDKTSSLVIESKETGTKNNFSVRDVQGNAVAKTGVADITQNAQDAKYKLNNGVEKTSTSNSVEIAKGVTAEFKATTSSSVKVESKKDATAITNSVYELVNNYNALLESAKSNSSDSGASRLASQLTGATKSYSSALAKVGINIDKEGYISLDKDKLSTSIENGNLQKALSPSNTSFSFTSKLQQISKKIDSDPTYYVSQGSKATLAESNTSSTNSSSSINKSYNYLNSYMNSKYTNMGMLFESLF